MNSRPMILRLVSGSLTPASVVDDDQSHPRRGHEVLLDLLGLAGAQQPVVDEHAGQLVTDGPLHQGGGHRGVDPARQCADHPVAADLGLDPLHLLDDDVARRPVGGQPGPSGEEVDQHLLTELAVLDLGVPLHPVQAPVVLLERGDGHQVGTGHHPEPRRGLDDAVAVAHPDRLCGRLAGEQRRTVGTGRERGAAVLAAAGVGDLAAQLQSHGLEAVAQPQGGYPGREQRGVEPGGTLGVDTGGPAGQDHRGRVTLEQLGHRPGVGHDLGVAPGLTHPAGDQLGVLGAEVDDQDRTVGGRGCGGA
jgi:hypothetical protein